MHYFMSFLVSQSSWSGRENWLLCFYCLLDVTLNVMHLFLILPRIGLQFVIVVFPDNTHLLFIRILI